MNRPGHCTYKRLQTRKLTVGKPHQVTGPSGTTINLISGTADRGAITHRSVRRGSRGYKFDTTTQPASGPAPWAHDALRGGLCSHGPQPLGFPEPRTPATRATGTADRGTQGLGRLICTTAPRTPLPLGAGQPGQEPLTRHGSSSDSEDHRPQGKLPVKLHAERGRRGRARRAEGVWSRAGPRGGASMSFEDCFVLFVCDCDCFVLVSKPPTLCTFSTSLPLSCILAWAPY